MAFYNDSNNVRKTNESAQYNKSNKIGTQPQYPGIYKCQDCGYEDVINRDCTTFPPCSSCQGSKGWKLLVQATDK